MFEGIKSVIRLESTLIPVYIYCLLKQLLPIPLPQGQSNPSVELYKLLLIFIRLGLTLVLLPVVLTILLLFGIYADFVRACAKFKYGDRYVTYYNGADAVYAGDPRPGKGIIPALYYIEAQGRTPQELMQHMKKSALQMMRNHPRMQSVRMTIMLYQFFIKQDIGLSMIDYFDDYANEEQFSELCDSQIASALPLDNTFLWDLHLGKKTLKINGKDVFPVLFRFHHSIGDGVTLITLLITNFSDDGYNTIKIVCDNLQSIMKRNETKLNENKEPVHVHKSDVWKLLQRLLDRLWHKECYFHYDMFKNLNAVNNLHWQDDDDGGKMDAHVAINTSVKDIMDKIKFIKRKLHVAFNDVVLGALAASLSKHFENIPLAPERIITANPYFLKAGKLDEILRINDRNEAVTILGNNFTVAFIALPICKDLLQDPKQFVMELNKETTMLKNSLDFQFVYWICNVIMTITPVPIGLPMNKLYDPTAIVTNLPSLTAIKVQNSEIVDMTLSSVHCYRTGAAVTVYGYNDTFHVTTFINKSLANHEERQAICDNLVKYIELIYDELAHIHT